MNLKTLLKRKKQILEEQRNKYEIPERYKKAEVPFLQKDRNDMYEEMNYKIDKEIGEILQQLYDYESDKYSIGIHRTASIPKDIFKEGIKYDDYPNIHDHVQIFDNFPFMLREISHAEGYKVSNGAFIIKVPKTSIKGKKDSHATIPQKKGSDWSYIELYQEINTGDWYYRRENGEFVKKTSETTYDRSG